jgi:hypothetical protein
MGKNFLSWMAAGLGALLSSVLQYFTAGNVVTVKSFAVFVGSWALFRAAQWVIANLGPKPV